MKGRDIIVCATGGVAAYKTAALVSRLVQEGAGVTVVLTAAAGRFVGPATFAALTGRPVVTDVFDQARHPLGAHIDLAARGEILCVAPATADFLAKTALGLADDLPSTLYLAFAGPVVMAPAMNSAMWNQPAVQRNVELLRRDGVHIVGPEEGWLSCRDVGPGRMTEPEILLDRIRGLVSEYRANPPGERTRHRPGG